MGSSLLLQPQGYPHTVKADGDVAALFHLEPNHNPRVDQPAQIWFALTRKGGESLPLDQCDCQLAIYREPETRDAGPILQPELTARDVERYLDVPATEVVFPEVGRYRLEFTGLPQAGASFEPFQLTYSVTVIP